MSEQDSTKRLARFIPRLVVLALFLGALGLYGATLSRGLFPGLPAKQLAWQLRIDWNPTLLDSLWGRMVRVWAALPGGSPALWAGMFSALFGAGVVALTALLMMRVRYPRHDKHDPAETARESQARWLAGVTAGLFAALNIPFWILSTRSLPGSFHLLLLLLAALLFSEYQRRGKTALLYGLGLVYGVGIAEFPTFWVLAPLAALLVLRAMLQRAAFSWPVLIRTGLCLIPGLLLYLWNGWTLWSLPELRLQGYRSLGMVIWIIWRDQWRLIAHAPQTAGFLLILLLTVGPWAVLYLMRPKKPAWRYSSWQVLLRLVVLAAAMGALFNAPLSPWHFFGMNYLMVTPYLILASCAGGVAGEFWVMGQVREHRRAGIGQPLRTAMGILALLLPVAALVAGYRNLPVADGRPGRILEEMAGEVLDGLQGRDVVISAGPLDDAVGLLARHRDLDVTVISVPLTALAQYRQYLSTAFPDLRHQALLQVGFAAFLQEFLSDPDGLRRTAAIDLADPLREYGYLVPDRLVYRAEPSPETLDLDLLVESQRPFWAKMEALAANLPAPRHPAHPHLQYVLRLASKGANNLGFSLVERGETAAAEALFHQARRILPENISALLNLLTIAQTEDRPEKDAYLAEWEAFKDRHVDSRVMWSLGGLYGYVHNTGVLVRHGMMWAISGKPRMAEAELRRASGGHAVDPMVKAFLARAYLHGGDLRRSAEYYRELLEENPRDLRSLLMLVQLAIRAEDYADAEALLTRAEDAGLPASAVRFERAVLDYLQGRPEQALANLKDLVRHERDHARAWSLLAMLTGGGRDEETFARALNALKGIRGTSPDVRLMLAELHMGRQEWAEARMEIEQVVRMDPRLVRAWEMLVTVDFHERKRDLAEDHVRILLTLDPNNYTGNLMLGSFQYARGQLLLAESSYRTALAARREPIVMNDLAYLLLLKGGALDEARALIDEAVARQPDNPLFRATRTEIHLAEDRLDEAEQDLQQVLAAMPGHASHLLLAARLYAARGQASAALELAESLAERQGELAPEYQRRLQDLLRQLR